MDGFRGVGVLSVGLLTLAALLPGPVAASQQAATTAFPVTGNLKSLTLVSEPVSSGSVGVEVSPTTGYSEAVDAGPGKVWVVVHASLVFDKSPVLVYFDQIGLRTGSSDRIPLSFFRGDPHYPFVRAEEGAGSFNKLGDDGAFHEIWAFLVDRGALEGRDRYGLVFKRAQVDIELAFLIEGASRGHVLSIADRVVELER